MDYFQLLQDSCTNVSIIVDNARIPKVSPEENCPNGRQRGPRKRDRWQSDNTKALPTGQETPPPLRRETSETFLPENPLVSALPPKMPLRKLSASNSLSKIEYESSAEGLLCNHLAEDSFFTRNWQIEQTQELVKAEKVWLSGSDESALSLGKNTVLRKGGGEKLESSIEAPRYEKSSYELSSTESLNAALQAL